VTVGDGAAVLRVDKVVAGGDALGREPSGRVVLVPGALPGELVRVRIARERRDVAFAVLDEVLEAAAARRKPPCPAVGRGCGGCAWQHVEPAAQLDLKRQIVVEALARTGGIDHPVVTAGATLPEHRYRTTVRLAVDPSGRMGFRARGRHDVVPVDDCWVAHPLLGELLAGVRAPGLDEVLLRVGARTGERSARWWPSSGPPPAGLPSDVQVGATACVHEVVDGVTLRVSTDTFFQVSPEAADALVAAVRAAAGPAELWAGGPVVDAYGGAGLFAATVVPRDVPVVLVESNPSACRDAAVNLAGRPATVVQRRVERWQPVRAPLVIADPARAGLGPGGVERIASTGAARLVLVSCDPVSLARDARLLRERGYGLVSSEVLDLFPQTTHVEVVSRFDRLEA
jgi:23S rRNA (uracil1939-C5)-methyltransferase